MKKIKHVEVIPSTYGWIDTSKCPCGDIYAHYLWQAAPEINWYYVEEVGSYQGDVYALGKYKGKLFVMHDYYGSCSGCGAWGEGGEPEKLKDVLGNGELFTSKKKAVAFAKQAFLNQYSSPTEDFWKTLFNL